MGLPYSKAAPCHHNTHTHRNNNIQVLTHPSPTTAPSQTTPNHTVFISHAGEDKATIAIPLREKLMKHGISAFVDETDMPVGTKAIDTITSAMQAAKVAVIVLSPEFVARKWPIKELLFFLQRREESVGDNDVPVIIPFFYRLKISELYNEPRFDRLDKDGNPLYLESRFFERMKNGEPETDIETLRASLQKLHGIMGVLNDVEASNDSAYIMYRRREMLLQELCNCVQQAMETTPMTRPTSLEVRTPTEDMFCPCFDGSQDISDLVFDFSSYQADDSNVSSQEARLLALVLNESRARHTTIIAVHGIGGVGKTSLMHGISNLDIVKQRFKDGIYHLSLGINGKLLDLIDELCKATERSGGRVRAEAMRREKKIENVIEGFRSWFKKRNCLFVVDDAWQTRDIPESVIIELLKLHVSGENSKILLTTRSPEIASWAGTSFGLKPRGTVDNESKTILIRYSGVTPESDEDSKALNDILQKCAGLPLSLAVAGKAIRALKLRRGHTGCAAYHTYAQNIRNNTQIMLTTGVASYERLDASLMTSMDILEERKDDLGFEVSLSIRQMHRRLSVLRARLKVPIRILKFLWELEEESHAAVVAGEFEKVGLADLEFERRGSEHVELLRLHESQFEFAKSEARKQREDRLGHQVLLRGYGRLLPVTEQCRAWWHTSLDGDDYIHGSLCRHLEAAGETSELVGLLLSPQWAERQLKVNGLLFLEADFAYGIGAIQNEIRNEGTENHLESEKALRLIAEAVSLSSGFIASNATELYFQLHGRLNRYIKSSRAIADYVLWIETAAERPLALCKSSFLGEPGGANTRIISVGVPLFCMEKLNDEERFACGCSDGRIAVVNIKRSIVQRQWKAHDEAVLAIGVGKDGTRLVSGSRDKTAKVWSIEEGRCVLIFKGHAGFVSSVVMMGDGRRVISCSQGSSAQVWDAETGQIESTLFTAHADQVDCVAELEDGRVVMGGTDGMLRLCNVATGAQVGNEFVGHDYSVNCVAVTPNRRRIVSGSWGEVRVWEVGSHQQIGSLLVEHNNSIECVAVSRNGHRICAGSWDKKIRVWNSGTGNEICYPLEGHGASVTAVSFLTDFNTIVSCSADGTVRMWDVWRKQAQRLPNRHEDSVTSICFSPEGKVLVSGSHDKTLRMWSTSSGQQVGEPLEGHSRSVNDVVVTPDNRLVVSVSDDRTVRIWDLESHGLLRTLTGHTGRIWCVAVTPQGDVAVTGSVDETIRVWDLRMLDGTHDVLEGHNDRIRRIFVTEDGLRVISVDLDHNVFVWDLETKQLVKRYTKENAWRLSKRQLFSLIGEASRQRDPPLSIQLYGREVVYGKGSDAQVLATMEVEIWHWALSSDKETISVGLEDGQVGFMKLKT